MTLLELLIAVSVSGIAIAGAAVLADGMRTAAVAVQYAQEARDARWAGEQMLRRLLLQAGLAAPGTRAMTGDRTSLRVTTWCDTPAGWQEPCVITLLLNGGQLLLRGRGSDRRLLEVGDSCEFRYLLTAADGGRWTDRWGAEPKPPIAVAIIGRDTIILRIGDRG